MTVKTTIDPEGYRDWAFRLSTSRYFTTWTIDWSFFKAQLDRKRT